MTDDLRMLDELEALEKRATPVPWSVVRSVTCGHLRAGHNMNTAEPAKEWTNHDIDLIEDARNALPTLLRLARRGLEADAAAQRAERAEAELEKMREMFNARGEVCTAVRSGISAMQNGTARDALVAEAETYAALNRLMALEKQDADLSPAPAPGSVTEGFEALRRIAGDDLPEPDMPDAGGAA